MIMWWQIEMGANTVIAACYFVISALILVPLHRAGQLRSNKLASATAMIFFSCALGHGLHAVHPFVGQDMSGMDMRMSTWWLAAAHAFTAGIAVYYLTLRRLYGRLMDRAPMFDDLREKQRLADLEQLEAEVLARSEAEADRDYYAQLMDSINSNNQSVIYVKDLDGRYVMVNPAFEATFGVRAEEVLGRTDDVIDPELAPTWRAADLKAREGRYRVEEVTEGVGGLRYWDSVKFPVYNTDGSMYATCGVSLDITESRLANVALAEARDAALAAAAAKSTFLATMSHEIRTPMNAVIGMTDLLLDTELDEQQQDFVATVRSSGDALLAVIDDILDFSKIESGELRLRSAPFQLRPEIESALDLVAAAAQAKNLDLVCYIEDTCPTSVVGDAGRLRQILINLLSNAVKFTPAGDVLVTVAALPVDDDHLQLRIDVTDTGIGISAAGVAKLFTSFSQVDTSTTRSYGGTGLGLVISRRLAQAMSGDITVVSSPGQGSTFKIVVELGRALTDGADPLTGPRRELTGRRVLVVDDNPTNLRILELQLTGLAMVPTTSLDPRAALELAAQGARFDLAVLDMHMPGLDGVQLAAELHRRPGLAELPVILLTSVGDRPPTDGQEFAAVISKPVKGEALRSAIIGALDGGVEPVEVSERARPHRLFAEPLRVLLAEDNLVNQRVAQLMLRKLGHSVDIVANGLDAVDAVAGSAYDVVLMDIQMPKLDGLAATRRIRAEVPLERQPHIIAMTASALVEDQRACSAAGMENFLTKPVRVAELQRMLLRVSASVHRSSSADRVLPDTPAAAPVTAASVGPAADAAGSPAAVSEVEVARPEVLAEAVDPTVLEKLRTDLEDADGSEVASLVDTYLTSLDQLLPQLSEALAAADVPRARSVAHALAASTAMVGAQGLAALLNRAQQLDGHPTADSQELAGLIAAESERVLTALARTPTTEPAPLRQ